MDRFDLTTRLSMNFWDLYHEIYSNDRYDNIGELLDGVLTCAKSLKFINLSAIDKQLKIINSGYKDEQQNAIENIYSLIHAKYSDVL